MLQWQNSFVACLNFFATVVCSITLCFLLQILFVATTTRSCSCWPTTISLIYPTESASSRRKVIFACERFLNAAHRGRHLCAFSAYFLSTKKTYRTRRSCLPLRIAQSVWNRLEISGFFNYLLYLTLLAPMSSARKAGSGRKRKCDSLTSGDYARKLAALEWRPDMTTAEQNEFKKKQRSLKNRLSALKSREKKRAQMVELERQVAALQEQVRELQKQNNELRRGLIISPVRTRCKSQSGNQACSDDIKNHNKRRCKTLGLPSLDELFPEQPKLSNVKKLELCAHNSESAVFTTRSSHRMLTVQYSHLLWGMQWITLRLTFLNLWTIPTRICLPCKSRIKSMMMCLAIFSRRGGCDSNCDVNDCHLYDVKQVTQHRYNLQSQCTIITFLLII